MLQKKKKKKKKKATILLLFLKAFSWETDFWVTLGDFNLYLTENRLGRNEM